MVIIQSTRKPSGKAGRSGAPTASRLFAAAALCIAAAGAAFAAPGDAGTINVQNMSGETLSELYIAPVEDTDWGDDLLNGRDFPSGAFRSVAAPRSRSGVYDLKAVIASGRNSGVYYMHNFEQEGRGRRSYSIGPVGQALRTANATNKPGQRARPEPRRDRQRQERRTPPRQNRNSAEDVWETDEIAALEEMEEEAWDSAPETEEAAAVAVDADNGAGVSALRQALLAEGEKHIGKPYVTPPNTPANFDCSGFVNYVYKSAAEMNLSPASASYATIGTEIDFKDAKPGDVLVFVSEPGGKKISHVAMLYQKSGTGDLRGSWVIHAVSIPVTAATIKGDSTKDGVIISELGKGSGEYFHPRYLMTRRFIED
ncbi:MAG: hydrolase Nlp/P60/C40 family peptidase [Treponematales bacterium]